MHSICARTAAVNVTFMNQCSSGGSASPSDSFGTYLGIQSVAKLADAACDLVEVDRLFPAVAFLYIHRHGEIGDSFVFYR